MKPLKKSRTKTIPSIQALYSERAASVCGLGADFDTRTLYLCGHVMDDMTYRFIVGFREMDRLPGGPITVVINSEGGAEACGYAIYDTMMMGKNLIVTEGIGAVQSIAALIFQAGDVRRLAPNSLFMVHNGSILVSDEVEQDTVVSLAEQIKRNNIRYHTILSERSGIPLTKVISMCKDETFLSAAESVAAGFADEVIEHNLAVRSKK